VTERLETVAPARPEHVQQPVPPGWTCNPSAWRERLPVVVLALAGAGIAGYLALYQLGRTAGVWEPVFGTGSAAALRSPLSRALAVPDEALGAWGYLLAAITGLVGSRRRWRTMPWIVLVHGLAVATLGAVNVALVIVQPVLLGARCTLCLASALISVLLIGPTMDEVLASLQHVRRRTLRGELFLRAILGLAPAPAGPPALELAAPVHRATASGARDLARSDPPPASHQ
jgi:uncharacterized membrane protein